MHLRTIVTSSRAGQTLASLFLLTATAFAQTPTLPPLELKPAFPALTFDRPMWMEELPDGSKRMILVEQAGRIWLLPADRNSGEKTIFLDISARKPLVQNEEGLLAFAFHPQFRSNGKFYIYYTQQSPKRNLLTELQVFKSDPSAGDLSSERLIMSIPQPYWNHDGSTVIFGQDGYLYMSTGDGGMGGDPHNVGQSLHQLLGKILGIDVDSRTGRLPYGIPKDNPFVAKNQDGSLKADPFDTKPEGQRPEIWAYGLRNVWRMSFDRETGELWAGDVGQDKWEEVNLITKGGNYGWSAREGFHPFKEQRTRGKLIDPVLEYAHKKELLAECKFPDHGLGISITGGYVYRGKKIPALQGAYVYADFQMGTIWGLRYADGKVTAQATLVKEDPSRLVASFAEDRDGELYMLSLGGKVYELTAATQ
jgi:glucose/arabinose dehydrogenase